MISPRALARFFLKGKVSEIRIFKNKTPSQVEETVFRVCAGIFCTIGVVLFGLALIDFVLVFKILAGACVLAIIIFGALLLAASVADLVTDLIKFGG